MTTISPENERFIEQEIAAGRFRDRSDAIDAGIALLRRRKELLDRVDEGRRQLDSGESHEYDDAALAYRFDELKGRARKSGSEQSSP
jgi:putative addiction module CopG family antidote